MAVLKRDEWVKLRDTVHKVKKGAVSGVSVGDALDAFHKEAAKGGEEAVAAAPKLKAAMDKYVKACKSEGLKKDIKTKILDPLAKVEKNAPYYKELAAAKVAWAAFKKQPNATTHSAAAKLFSALREDGDRKYPDIKGISSNAHGAHKWFANETPESTLKHGSDIEQYIKKLGEL